MAQYIIGLDLGSWSTKALVLESSLRRMSFHSMREQKLNVDSTGTPLEGEVERSIAAALEKYEGETTVVGVPGTQILWRELELPFADEKSVAPILGFRLDGMFPRPIDSLTYDWHVLKKDEDGATLLCPAVDKEWLEDWVGKLETSGVHPRLIVPSMLTWEHLPEHLLVPEGLTAFLDIGHRSTQIAFFENGKIANLRTLSLGGHQITQAIARGLDIPYSEAEKRKHLELDLASGDKPELQAAALPGVRTLLSQIMLSFDALSQGENRPQNVLLFGGGSKLQGLGPLLESQLKCKLISPTLNGNLWGNKALAQEEKAVALPGLALALEQLSPKHHHRADLRPADMVGRSDFSAIKSRANWLIGFAVLFLLAIFGRKILHIQTLSAHEEKMGATLDRYAQEVLGLEVSQAPTVQERFENTYSKVIAAQGSEEDEVYPKLTAFHLFYNITKIQNDLNQQAPTRSEDEDEDEGGASSQELPITERKMIELSAFAADIKNAREAVATVSGSGYDIVTIEKFAESLRQHPCFKKVDRQETKSTVNRDRPGWTDFTIKVDVNCAAHYDAQASL